VEPGVLVDSDILIASLRGYPPAKTWLTQTAERRLVTTSVVSVYEIVAGMRPSEDVSVHTLLSELSRLPITEEVAWHAGEYSSRYARAYTGIGLGDYLIAATSAVHGLELATLNVRHFPMFPHLAPPFTA
jgi:predicted nucleic acid-binding protein